MGTFGYSINCRIQQFFEKIVNLLPMDMVACLLQIQIGNLLRYSLSGKKNHRNKLTNVGEIAKIHTQKEYRRIEDTVLMSVKKEKSLN